MIASAVNPPRRKDNYERCNSCGANRVLVTTVCESGTMGDKEYWARTCFGCGGQSRTLIQKTLI